MSFFIYAAIVIDALLVVACVIAGALGFVSGILSEIRKDFF